MIYYHGVWISIPFLLLLIGLIVFVCLIAKRRRQMMQNSYTNGTYPYRYPPQPPPQGYPASYTPYPPPAQGVPYPAAPTSSYPASAYPPGKV